MVEAVTRRLSRDDWLKAALAMCATGIDNVKVATLAESMGVTTGSFYWHFKNRRELLDALLEYWEREMTDAAVTFTLEFEGSATDRILFLMETVMEGNLARYDLPIWQWAQSDESARRVFERALEKRFSFSARMFAEAGFSPDQAAARGRMMVAYMMAESTLIKDPMAKSREAIRTKHAILTTTA